MKRYLNYGWISIRWIPSALWLRFWRDSSRCYYPSLMSGFDILRVSNIEKNLWYFLILAKNDRHLTGDFLPIHWIVKLLKLLQIRFEYHKFFMISRVHIDSSYVVIFTMLLSSSVLHFILTIFFLKKNKKDYLILLIRFWYWLLKPYLIVYMKR